VAGGLLLLYFGFFGFAFLDGWCLKTHWLDRSFPPEHLTISRSSTGRCSNCSALRDNRRRIAPQVLRWCLIALVGLLALYLPASPRSPSITSAARRLDARPAAGCRQVAYASTGRCCSKNWRSAYPLD